MRLVFWNCGVRSTATRKTGRSVQDAADVVGELLAGGVDAIALCEVDEAAIEAIHDMLKPIGRFDALPVAYKSGRVQWDFGLICRHGRMLCTLGQPAINTDRGKGHKGGHGIAIECDKPFFLYLSHWRSRVPERANESIRKAQAEGLWRVIREVMVDGHSVVLMGDFNDEPFDPSMNEILYTTRDAQLASEKRVPILYNPTWNLVAPSEPYGLFGTTSYRGESSYRHALQQALVSPDFLTHNPPHAPTTKIHAVGDIDHRKNEHQPLELELPI